MSPCTDKAYSYLSAHAHLRICSFNFPGLMMVFTRVELFGLICEIIKLRTSAADDNT